MISVANLQKKSVITKVIDAESEKLVEKTGICISEIKKKKCTFASDSKHNRYETLHQIFISSNTRGQCAIGLHTEGKKQPKQRGYEHDIATDSGVGQDVPQE